MARGRSKGQLPRGTEWGWHQMKANLGPFAMDGIGTPNLAKAVDEDARRLRRAQEAKPALFRIAQKEEGE